MAKLLQLFLGKSLLPSAGYRDVCKMTLRFHGFQLNRMPPKCSSLILDIEQVSASCINLYPCFNIAGFMLASFFHFRHTLPGVFISDILRLHPKRSFSLQPPLLHREEGTLPHPTAARTQVKAATFLISSLETPSGKHMVPLLGKERTGGSCQEVFCNLYTPTYTFQELGLGSPVQERHRHTGGTPERSH